MRAFPLIVLALASLACVVPESGAGLYASAPLERDGEPILYGRDGAPVSGPPATVEEPGTTRRVEGEEESRLYLLELYQQAIDEKEALSRELETTRALLLTEQEKSTRLEEDLALERESASRASERAELLQAEGLDLAARLTTAQIRRLEAEKLLLEAKIQWDKDVARQRAAGQANGGER